MNPRPTTDRRVGSVAWRLLGAALALAAGAAALVIAIELLRTALS